MGLERSPVNRAIMAQSLSNSYRLEGSTTYSDIANKEVIKTKKSCMDYFCFCCKKAPKDKLKEPLVKKKSKSKGKNKRENRSPDLNRNRNEPAKVVPQIQTEMIDIPFRDYKSFQATLIGFEKNIMDRPGLYLAYTQPETKKLLGLAEQIRTIDNELFDLLQNKLTLHSTLVTEKECQMVRNLN